MNQTYKCAKRITSGSFFSHPCNKAAKAEHKGHWYCGMHDPVKVAARRAEREAIRCHEMNGRIALAQRDAAAKREQIRRAACHDELLAALVEMLAAGENCLTSEDDVAAMLRFGDAHAAARAAIRKATGEPA